MPVDDPANPHGATQHDETCGLPRTASRILHRHRVSIVLGALLAPSLAYGISAGAATFQWSEDFKALEAELADETAAREAADAKVRSTTHRCRPTSHSGDRREPASAP